MKGQRVQPGRLWIRPALLAVFMVIALATTPRPDLFGFAVWAVAAVAGAGAGWLVARHQQFTIDPQTGVVTGRTSPLGVVLFLGVFALRFVVRLAMTGGQAPGAMIAHSAQIAVYTDALLWFAVAMVCMQAWEIWRRTKPLLMEHAVRASAEPPPT